ncbi:MAG: PEP-CTERM sorting domain-containing protein [Candidatus Syntrophoarchaeum sp.]|nr:PEP-CTERM sorting domain-containing protein [Candidatus Syntrophoarchaeum sp.]
MKTIRMALVGVFLMMLVMPAVAAYNIDIFMDWNHDGNFACDERLVPGANYTVTAGVEYDFIAHFYDWGADSFTWNFDVGGRHDGEGTTYQYGGYCKNCSCCMDCGWWSNVLSYTPVLDETFEVSADCLAHGITGYYGSTNVTFEAASITAVPEPTTLALTALGMLGVLGFVRRRREA